MRVRTVLVVLLPLVMAACTAASGGTSVDGVPPVGSALGTDTAVVDVYKSPDCECCHEWEAYLRDEGYTVRSIAVDDLKAVKDDHGVPMDAWSCHTAIVDGYVVEGHVPVEAIEDLLARRPAIDGIALPGMPPGSPGMPGLKEAPFEVLAFDEGVLSPFGSY